MKTSQPASSQLQTSLFNQRRLPLILQAEAAECGIACMAMIAGYHGYKTDLHQLRRRFSISMRGVNLKQLRDMAQGLQLAARPLKLELEELADLQRPCILHWDLNHFVVLKSVNKRGIVIHDPATGVKYLNWKECGEHFTGIAMELTPTAEFEAKTDKQSIRLTSLWSRIQGLWRSLAVVLLLSLLLQVFAIASPFFMQIVVDDVIVRADTDLLLILALGFGLLMLVQILTSSVRSLMILHLSSHLNLQMANNLFRHLIRLPMQFFEKRHMGDIVSRFGSMQAIQDLLTSGIVATIIDGLMAIITLVIMFYYSVTLTLVVLVATVLYFALRLLLYRPLRVLSEEALVAGAKHQSHFMESIRAIQSVKIFQLENDRQAHWQNHYTDSINKGIRIGHWNVGYETLNALLFGIENIIIIYLAAQSVLTSAFSIGMIYAFMSYKQRFISSMDGLISQFIEFKMLGLHLERLSDIVLTQPEPNPADNDDTFLQASHLNGQLTVKNACFSYSEAEASVFSDVNFSVNAGESVAIIGPSGCGKTTLIKCMMGLLTLDEGVIEIDDRPLADVANYRSRIAAVMQDDQLVSGSLADNICCFDTFVDQDFIMECARMANIHNDITAMPMGYNTLVGDMGASLSGGQKQRILLARAIYRKPDVLFLDEATSHLDAQTEQGVSEHIRQLQITRIMVAHRQETIASADRVIDLSVKH